MNTIECIKLKPVGSNCCCDCSDLENNCNCVYKGIALDKCAFYLTCPDRCEIHKYDKCFCFCKRINVCRPYTSICFDCCEDCFYALCSKEKNKIYKLDKCFCEIDCITISLYECCCSFINGISSHDGYLLICGSFGVAKINKCDGAIISVNEKCEKDLNNDAITTNGCYTVLALRMQKCNIIKLLEKKCNVCNLSISECYQTEDMTFEKCNDLNRFYILLTKNNCYSYILICKICYVDEECECQNDCCYSDCCHDDCHDKITCCESAGGLIESISLIETALSHILNAEGEKIQKILCSSDNNCEIMKVNEAVNKTVINITHLEQILYGKLQIAKDLCDCDDCK